MAERLGVTTRNPLATPYSQPAMCTRADKCSPETIALTRSNSAITVLSYPLDLISLAPSNEPRAAAISSLLANFKEDWSTPSFAPAFVIYLFHELKLLKQWMDLMRPNLFLCRYLDVWWWRRRLAGHVSADITSVAWSTLMLCHLSWTSFVALIDCLQGGGIDVCTKMGVFVNTVLVFAVMFIGMEAVVFVPKLPPLLSCKCMYIYINVHGVSSKW